MTEKKRAIIYGNCHMSILTEYLSKNRFFSAEYFPHWFFVRDGNISDEFLSQCDLFICQVIREDNLIGCPSSNYYKEKADRVGGINLFRYLMYMDSRHFFHK